MNIDEFLYIPQSFKNLLREPRIVSKEAMMEDTQDKMSINKNVVGMILESIKGNNTRMMF